MFFNVCFLKRGQYCFLLSQGCLKFYIKLYLAKVQLRGAKGEGRLGNKIEAETQDI